MGNLENRESKIENREFPPRLSAELADLREGISEHGVTLGDMMDRLHGRGFMLFLILLSVPFCQPIPLPGLSVIFGLVISLIGLRITLRQKPWLPGRARRVLLSGKTMEKLFAAAAWLIKWIEKWSRPRSVEHFEGKWIHSLYGIVILLSGILLLLPPPFVNFLPGVTVFLCAVAMMEDDDKIGLFGVGAFAVTVVAFGALFLSGASLIKWVGHWFA